MAMFLAYTSDADQVSYTENQVTGTLIEKSIGANGIYNALDDRADGYSKVTVSVPSSTTLITKNITQNGNYSASSDSADGYSNVSVNVTSGTVAPKNITENGTYNASSENLDGYSSVTVSVPQSGSSAVLIHKDISADGTYYASSDNADGFSSVTVTASGTSSDMEMVVSNSSGSLERYISSYWPANYGCYGRTFDVTRYVDLYGNRITADNFIVQLNDTITDADTSKTPEQTTTVSSEYVQINSGVFKELNRTNKTLAVGRYGYFKVARNGTANTYYLSNIYTTVSIIFVPPTT